METGAQMWSALTGRSKQDHDRRDAADDAQHRGGEQEPGQRVKKTRPGHRLWAVGAVEERGEWAHIKTMNHSKPGRKKLTPRNAVANVYIMHIIGHCIEIPG